MKQLIAIDPRALDTLISEVKSLRREVQSQVRKPDWLTVGEYAAIQRCSRRTVMRRIDKGTIETRQENGVKMVRV